jgi:putative SOS response-associated peptidase YedK
VAQGRKAQDSDVDLPQEPAAVWTGRAVGRMAQSRSEAGESFTIITTEPNELVRPVHNRMPVILKPEDEEQWLDASRTPYAKAKSLLKPYPEELMDAHDVSPVVNSAKYDRPECIQPASDNDMARPGQLSLL